MRVSVRRFALLLLQAFLVGIICYQILRISAMTTLALTSSFVNSVGVQEKEKPFVTLFTTFALDARREPITRLVIHNWASLRPAVQPVLFTSAGSGWAVEEARLHGWTVVRVPGVNSRGTPFIKAMFKAAYHLVDSHFYCFANGDLFFSESFVENLRAVDDFVSSEPNVSDVDYARPFVFGRRSDLPFNDSRSLHEVSLDAQSIWKVARNRSKLAPSDTEDYFITLRNGYPWDRVPDLVVGRVAVDNYLVLMARYHKMMTVDLTITHKVLHLKQRGSQPFRPDGGYNKDLLQRLHPNGLPWAQGVTTRARIGTKYAADRRIIVAPRDGYIPFVKGKYFEKYEQTPTFNDTHVQRPSFQILRR